MTYSSQTPALDLSTVQGGRAHELAVEIRTSDMPALKAALRHAIPDVAPRSRLEYFARACGFRTAAAMQAAMKVATPDQPVILAARSAALDGVQEGILTQCDNASHHPMHNVASTVIHHLIEQGFGPAAGDGSRWGLEPRLFGLPFATHGCSPNWEDYSAAYDIVDSTAFFKLIEENIQARVEDANPNPNKHVIRLKDDAITNVVSGDVMQTPALSRLVVSDADFQVCWLHPHLIAALLRISRHPDDLARFIDRKLRSSIAGDNAAIAEIPKSERGHFDIIMTQAETEDWVVQNVTCARSLARELPGIIETFWPKQDQSEAFRLEISALLPQSMTLDAAQDALDRAAQNSGLDARSVGILVSLARRMTPLARFGSKPRSGLARCYALGDLVDFERTPRPGPERLADAIENAARSNNDALDLTADTIAVLAAEASHSGRRGAAILDQRIEFAQSAHEAALNRSYKL